MRLSFLLLAAIASASMALAWMPPAAKTPIAFEFRAGELKKILVATVSTVALSISFNQAQEAHAIIAPLADVGIGKYLVKDGRQLLRLSLPVGPDMKLGRAAKETPEMKAQEVPALSVKFTLLTRK